MPSMAAEAAPLRPGAVWKGSQTSGQAKYDVEVRICSVDEQGDVSGTLTIRNLTPALPKLVTYFDGEIIGEKHSLVTGKWEASEDDDRRHWSRFRRDLGLKGGDSLDDDTLDSNSSVVLMRLKERSIVSAGQDADACSGASFAGFYYIAIDLKPAAALVDDVLPSSPSSSPRMPSRPLSPPAWGRTSQPPLSVRTATSPSPPLVRTGSYASAVRGRAAPVTIPPATANGSIAGTGNKTDDTFNVSVASVSSFSSSGSSFSSSLSFEDFPLPSSPTTSPNRNGGGFPFHARTSALKRHNSEAVVRSSTRFYNSSTGYRGPYAHATMKGFYFAASTDPYQELELHYVGDGMGLLLEEYAEAVGGLDEWGNPKPVDERSVLSKEFQRRERFAQPRGSASFTIL